MKAVSIESLRKVASHLATKPYVDEKVQEAAAGETVFASDAEVLELFGISEDNSGGTPAEDGGTGTQG